MGKKKGKRAFVKKSYAPGIIIINITNAPILWRAN
jgi:hypothetical protein